MLKWIVLIVSYAMFLDMMSKSDPNIVLMIMGM